MKVTHIVLLCIAALACGVSYVALTGSNKYATFTQAEKDVDATYQVAGTLNKKKPVEYDPAVNANVFSFYLLDREGKERKVLLNRAKPYDFEKADEIIITGKLVGNEFHASDILLKCPSKYNDAEKRQVSAN